MKPNRIDIYHFRQPFSIRFHSPQALRVRADSLLVAIHFENGITGWGECVPRDYVTGETTDSVLEILQSVAEPLLFAADIQSLSDIRRLLQDLAAGCRSSGRTPFQCAVAAVDLALIDALGHQGGHPMAALFSRGERPKTVLRSLSIPFLPAELIQRLFPVLREQMGLGAVKVLVGPRLGENIERVSAVRQLAGPDMPLRIEVNGKWSLDTALRQMEALIRFQPAGVEQPLPPGHLNDLRKFREATGLPVIVDESLCSVDDARLLIEEDACDLFNIKVSKCGGLMASLTIAEMAEAAGMGCQVGSHIGETDILGNAAEFLVRNGISRDLWFDVGSQFLLSGPEGDPAKAKENVFDGSRPGIGVTRKSLQRLVEASEHRMTLTGGR
ncbi:MAG: enolase C-terminal domain-like protein [Desulfobacterales bacterium]